MYDVAKELERLDDIEKNYKGSIGNVDYLLKRRGGVVEELKLHKQMASLLDSLAGH